MKDNMIEFPHSTSKIELQLSPDAVSILESFAPVYGSTSKFVEHLLTEYDKVFIPARNHTRNHSPD